MQNEPRLILLDIADLGRAEQEHSQAAQSAWQAALDFEAWGAPNEAELFTEYAIRRQFFAFEVARFAGIELQPFHADETEPDARWTAIARKVIADTIEYAELMHKHSNVDIQRLRKLLANSDVNCAALTRYEQEMLSEAVARTLVPESPSKKIDDYLEMLGMHFVGSTATECMGNNASATCGELKHALIRASASVFRDDPDHAKYKVYARIAADKISDELAEQSILEILTV